MAKNQKPKFLEAETTDLLNMMKEVLSEDEVDEKNLSKAMKITEELISRQPNKETTLSVDEALRAAASTITDALNQIKDSYEKEISTLDDSEESDEVEKDMEPETESEKPKKKAKKDKGEKKSRKKAKKEEEPEESEDEESEDESEDEPEDAESEEDNDYSDWSLKELKKECRNRGIKVNKDMSKSDMVKALEVDDKE